MDHAQKERELCQNVDSADAMAWALPAAGRDDEALEYAAEAKALECEDATFRYQCRMIDPALGMEPGARESQRTALETNLYFSPLHAPLAQAALDDLGELVNTP